LVALGLVGLILKWLESWQDLTISLLGQEVARFDLVQFIGLEKLLEQLQVLASVSGPVLLLAILVLALVSGALLALIIILVGLVYNLLAVATGGLVVEMNAVGQLGAEQPPASVEQSPEDIT
jgi:hypothetical protein